MQTNHSANQNLNPKDFLTTLQKLKSIPNYQNLGFTLKSLCNLSKSAIILSIEKPELTEHNK